MPKSVLAAALSLSISSAAFAQVTTPLPLLTTYATIIQKPGCNTLVFSAAPTPGPAVAVGQAMDVQLGSQTCSGTVAKVAQQFVLQRYPTTEVRSYVTTIILR